MPSLKSSQILESMNTDTIIAEADLSSSKPTGATHHSRGGKEIERTAVLKLVRLAGDESVFLIHYGKEGDELTDTCHSSVGEALEQAEFEYALKKEDWNFIAAK